MKRNILITEDENGKKLVVIPKIIFWGKRSMNWKEVEKYLLRYAGEIIEVTETKDIIYIGKDFADEYAGSKYTKKLNGANRKAKANMAQIIPELIEIGTEKRWSKDYEDRHGKKAKRGWYRYNTRFALPKTDEEGSIIAYKIYKAVLLVRYADDGKLYLYDVINLKHEEKNVKFLVGKSNK